MLDAVTKGHLVMHPESAARTLARIDRRDAAAAFSAMPRQVAAQVLAQMAPAPAARCVLALPGGIAGEILSRTELPAVVAALRLLDDRQVRGLLDEMPRPRAARVRLRLRFSEWVVGAFVDEDVLTLSPEHHVGDALRLFRASDQRAGTSLAVVDAQRRLVGIVDLLDLLNSADRRVIRYLMQPPTHVLNARAAMQSVANHPGWLLHDSLPVVNRNGLFQGVLRRDRIIATEQVPGGPAIDSNELMNTRAALADIFWLAIGALFVSPGHADKHKGGDS